MPHAMNAAMFGMIIPDRKVPNFCTAILAPERPAGADVVALTGFPPGGDGWTSSRPRSARSSPAGLGTTAAGARPARHHLPRQGDLAATARLDVTSVTYER
jgi:hypothetical protein